MQLTVNGQPVETKAATLAMLLEELGYAGALVATALNGNFVPAGQRLDVAVQQNDRIEILAPMKGG